MSQQWQKAASVVGLLAHLRRVRIIFAIAVALMIGTVLNTFTMVQDFKEATSPFAQPTGPAVAAAVATAEATPIDQSLGTDQPTLQDQDNYQRNTTVAPADVGVGTEEPLTLCQNYNGILLVVETLTGSGTGTVFYQSMLNYLIYADKYNLYPWIHVNVSNKVCYDDIVHGGEPPRSFVHKAGSITEILSTHKMTCRSMRNRRPGPPNMTSFEIKNFTLVGNGMWASYFEPPLPLPLDRGSCPDAVPIFTLTSAQAVAGLHMCSDLALRGWPTKGLPAKLWPRKEQKMKDWLWEHRKRGARMVQKYVRPLRWLQQLIDVANNITDQKCLAMHVRLTDKASGREKKDYKEYLKYALIYAELTKHQYPIYLATDDARVVAAIREALSPAVVLMQENVVRSVSDHTPTFDMLPNDRHRINTEALVEIYAMAKCGYLVHGYSTMSEAAVYISPYLHTRSVNIDDPDHLTESELRDMLIKDMEKTKRDV